MLSTGDYLEGIERIHATLNQVPDVVSSLSKISNIQVVLVREDSTLQLLKRRLSLDNRTFNLQNLQLFRTLLDEMKSKSASHDEQVSVYDSQLDSVKKQIVSLRKDTVIHQLFTTKALRDTFQVELKELKKKRVVTDSLLQWATTQINGVRKYIAANELTIQDLYYQIDTQFKAIGPKAFLKERRYLWEGGRLNRKGRPSEEFRQMIDSEQVINQYYFENTRSNRLLLLFFGILFFGWVFYNFRSVQGLGKMDLLEDLDLRLLKPVPILASLSVIFTLAPVFDLEAPALYIDLTQILLLLILTALFFSRMPRSTFWLWVIFSALFVTLPIVRLLALSPTTQRWLILSINLLSFLFAFYAYRKLRGTTVRYKIILWVGVLYMLFQGLAILANLFGRITLMQIFYTAGVYALLHVISLIVLRQLLIESFLVQVVASRVRKRYADHFEWEDIAKEWKGILTWVAIFIWVVLLTAHLDVYEIMRDSLTELLSTSRKIGSFTFTFGGIFLFLGIIWVANFLQKYVAYFFGEVGDDTLDHVGSEHSRLLITRLILLIAGFLLAIAASGLPVDKITVVLGALGVGIGLGLQSIVSNFISGIILIFDRTIRIGDVVEVGDRKGKVKEIGIRSSTLLSDDGAEIIIPNGDILSNSIINWTLSNNNVRVYVSITIAKPFDREEVVELVRKIVLANEGVLKRRAPSISISPINAKWAKIELYFWCHYNQTTTPKNEISDAIYQGLLDKQIEAL